VTIEVEPSLNTTTIEQNGKLVEVPDPDELPRIKQIKGKQNRAPNPEYLPFVQDFVKSGKWSDVGDLQNSGLLDISKLKGGYSLGMRDADYQILGYALRKRDPNMRSVSQTLADALPPDAANYMTREELFRYLGVEGFAHGGPVQTKPFSISDLQAIIASLRQEHINA